MTLSRERTSEPEASAGEILCAGLARAAGPVSLACSFSVEDVILIDLSHRLELPVGVFAIDTGRLNEETYEVAEAVSERYGITIDWHLPDREALERLEREKGLFSFRTGLAERRECCRIRKVEPLGRALQGLGGWVTGLRRDQAVTRQDLQPLEPDPANGDLLKISPLLDWHDGAVWSYARQRRLPLNRLYDQGYASIGCAPCTRAVGTGEHPRAGRWWWEDPEHKECGLHRR